MDGIIRLLYSFKFSVFGVEMDSGNLIGSVQKLTNFSSVQSINIWSIGRAVNNVIVPIALSLLILFFMINLIKKAMEVDRISWERIAMSFVSFLLLKYFIQNGYTFLSTIMNIVNDIFVSVTNAISNSNSSINIADTLINAVPDGFVDSIMTVQYFLFAASVGLEAVIIYIATNVYAIGLSGLSSTVGSTSAISTIVAMLFLNGMYLAVIQYGSQFAERLTGGH